jgi:tetratricopeptide (TPR) repeat protein
LSLIARQREGTLAECAFPILLCAFSSQQRSLVLELKRNHLEKRVVFEAGVPVECDGNMLHETLGKFLIRNGKLDEDNYHKALNIAATSDSSMGEVLLKLELISAFELFKSLQASLAHKLLDVFSWDQGTYRVSGDLPDADSSLKVNVPQLMLTGVMRFLSQEVVDGAMASFIGTPLAVHPDEADALAALRLNAKQSRVVQELTKRPRIDELLALGVLDPAEVSRLIYALGLLGMVRPADQVPVAAPVKDAPKLATAVESASGAAPASAPTPSLSAAEAAARKEALMKFYIGHRRLDAFELLDLPLDAQPKHIRQNYLSYAERYAPWRFQNPEISSLAEKAEELFLAGARAFGALSDPDQRSTLINRRKNRDGKSRKNPHAFAIKTDLLDADAQFKKGLAQKKAGNFSEAVKMLEFAVDCDQQNGNFRAELAYCRFLDRAELAEQALKELVEAVRIDPKAGIAMFYAGEIAVARGDRAGAHAFYGQAVQRMPNDDRARLALAAL